MEAALRTKDSCGGEATVLSVDFVNESLRVEQTLPDGYEVVETPIPALVTVSNELYEFRCVSFGALSKAQKGPVTIWNAPSLVFVFKPKFLGRVKLLIKE